MISTCGVGPAGRAWQVYHSRVGQGGLTGWGPHHVGLLCGRVGQGGLAGWGPHHVGLLGGRVGGGCVGASSPS